MSNNKNTLKSLTLTSRCKAAKKITLVVLASIATTMMLSTTAFAAGTVMPATVNATEFIDKACVVLQALLSLIGAGLGIWGAVNLIEGYGNDNPGAKSQGMKQLMAGIALIAVGLILVPVLKTMMTDATSTGGGTTTTP